MAVCTRELLDDVTAWGTLTYTRSCSVVVTGRGSPELGSRGKPPPSAALASLDCPRGG